MKKFGIFLLIVLVIAGGLIYHYRYDIFQFSAESIIKRLLPAYVHVDRIIFNLREGVLQVKGFGIKNPAGFQDKYLATIEEVVCRYKMQGKNILDGIEVTSIEGKRPVINIERLPSGKLNVNEMGEMMEKEAPKTKPQEKPSQEKEKPAETKKKASDKKLSDIIKLTDTINISDGKIVFVDKAVMKRPYMLTFEGVNGNVILDLSDDYREVLDLKSVGRGYVGGDAAQRVGWTITMNPQTPELTMGNRFEVSDVDILQFAPYYERYSPVDIKSGRFSGTLVFDFDNGSIGSTNTVKLSNFKFQEKQASSASSFWDVGIADLVKYLKSYSGDIIFDFKIKGTMDSPRFYPGPRVKEAMQSMVVDKVTDMLSGPKGEGAPAGGEKTDVEKAVDIFKSLMNR